MPISAPGQVILEHGRGRLLHLQEQRVVRIPTLQQDDVGPSTDAPDAHDLAGHVEHLELLEQVPSVISQRRAVAAELLVDGALELLHRVALARRQLPHRYDHRWVAEDPVATLQVLRQLREGLQAVTGVRLLHPLPGALLDRGGSLLVGALQ